MSTTSETDEIRRELTAISQRLQAVEARLGQNGEHWSASKDLELRLAEMREITEQYFPGECRFSSEFDPENPNDRYLVVNVKAQGNPKDIVDRTCDWHERIRSLSTELTGRVRLSVAPF